MELGAIFPHIDWACMPGPWGRARAPLKHLLVGTRGHRQLQRLWAPGPQLSSRPHTQEFQCVWNITKETQTRAPRSPRQRTKGSSVLTQNDRNRGRDSNDGEQGGQQRHKEGPAQCPSGLRPSLSWPWAERSVAFPSMHSFRRVVGPLFPSCSWPPFSHAVWNLCSHTALPRGHLGR